MVFLFYLSVIQEIIIKYELLLWCRVIVDPELNSKLFSR